MDPLAWESPWLTLDEATKLVCERRGWAHDEAVCAIVGALDAGAVTLSAIMPDGRRHTIPPTEFQRDVAYSPREKRFYLKDPWDVLDGYDNDDDVGSRALTRPRIERYELETALRDSNWSPETPPRPSKPPLEPPMPPEPPPKNYSAPRPAPMPVGEAGGPIALPEELQAPDPGAATVSEDALVAFFADYPAKGRDADIRVVKEHFKKLGRDISYKTLRHARAKSGVKGTAGAPKKPGR
jgi:hypothetical protein